MLNSVQQFLLDGFIVEDGIRAFVLKHPYEIVWLVNRFNVSFYDIVGLNEGIRAFIIENPCLIEFLVDRAHVPFGDILTLDENMRALLLIAGGLDAIDSLVNRANVSLNDILALNERMRTLVIWNHNTIDVLVNLVGVSFDEIVALEEECCDLVLKIVERLVKSEKDVPFEQLKSLSVEDLSTVINDPSSLQAQDILHPPRLSCVIS